MIQPLIRKIRTVLRYLFPSATDRAYVAKMLESNQFDRRYYLNSNPRLKYLFRIWPERHYVQLGEMNGLCPNPRFSPRAYLYHNPDLDRPGLRPLLHYISAGKRENRLVLAPPGHDVPDATEFPEIQPADAPAKPQPFAIVLHIYYAEFWEEMTPLLEAQTFPFDLFATVTKQDGSGDLISKIKNRFPNANVWQFPNYGRDIFPFVHLANSGLLSRYQAICKVHSKKSPHRPDGNAWRRTLIAGILGDPHETARRLSAFLGDTNAGFWVSDGQLYDGPEWWGANRDRAEDLLRRIGVMPETSALKFPAGSIYWTKPQIIEQLAALELTPHDFEPEQALVDGTTPHAIERIMGTLGQSRGFDIRQSSDLD